MCSYISTLNPFAQNRKRILSFFSKDILPEAFQVFSGKHVVRITARLVRLSVTTVRSLSDEHMRLEADRGNLSLSGATLARLALMDVVYYSKAPSDLPMF